MLLSGVASWKSIGAARSWSGLIVDGWGSGCQGVHRRVPSCSPRWNGQLTLGKSYISVMSALNCSLVSHSSSTLSVKAF